MSRIASLGVACALSFTLLSTASARPSSGDACAPGGMRLPRFTLLTGQGGGTHRLHLQADPALVGGGAMLLFEDPFGPDLPPGPCVTGLRGRLILVRTISSEGRATWDIPPVAAGRMTTLRALAWPAGGGWAEAHVSSAIVLPPHHQAGPDTLSKLVISEFQKDPTVVGDSKGEWIEITNGGASPVDIEGWSLADLGTDQTVLSAGGAGMIVPPGGRLVLGNEQDSALNGGIPVDFTYSGFTLSNGEDEIVLVRPDGTVADQILYDDGVQWPDDAGLAISLDPASMDAASNDDGANWCSATSVIGNGPDTGTPGAVNDDC